MRLGAFGAWFDCSFCDLPYLLLEIIFIIIWAADHESRTRDGLLQIWSGDLDTQRRFHFFVMDIRRLQEKFMLNYSNEEVMNTEQLFTLIRNSLIG